jgi:HD superfamily phosphodiesterase
MRMAGIEVIDSALTKQCIDLARTHSSPYLFNHVIRSWLMSTLEVKPDPEVVACATLLHDLGITQKYEANERFEVDGANAARAFLRGHGMKDRDLQLVWDSIALHTTPSITIYKEPEVACCAAGIGADIIGAGLERFNSEDVERIN